MAKKSGIFWQIMKKKKTTAEITRYLHSDNITVLVAKTNENLVGFAVGESQKGVNQKKGNFDIYIKKEYHKKGVGKKLMTELTKQFKEKNRRSISVNYYKANKNARQFYEKMGFNVISETSLKKI
ncbi:MAG: GNAT family N-acetyltransferase [Candidatus Diapherotrites archaeon]|nr:GNAT family N-acetyltransferase [Candidatus Diapherotrites archaeon]